MDGKRLLADGPHRVRRREATARAGGRQHPGRRPNEDGLFGVEHADVLGILFEFTTKPVPTVPAPRENVLVRAVTPERDACESRRLIDPAVA